MNLYVELCIVLIAILVYFYLKKKPQIPGPYCLPFVGYLPFLGKYPHKTFIKLGKAYGNVFKVKLGTVDVVILNDWAAIKEALSKDAFLGQPKDTIFNAFFPFEPFGLMDGDEWKKQRFFFTRTFKDLGIGKIEMETQVEEIIDDLCAEINKANGEPNNLALLVNNSTLNVLFTVLTGKRMSLENREFNKILSEALIDGVLGSFIGFAAFFPKLAQIFAKLEIFGCQKLKQFFLNVKHFSESQVSEQETEDIDESNVNSYISAFLCEVKANQKSGRKTTFTREMLVDNLMSFLMAGVETINNLVDWILLIVCYFPECQRRIQQEIDSVVGDDRKPRFSDRNQMVYTQAVIMEVQRWISIVPLNVPRRTMCDTCVQGIRIPKDTQIIANFYAVSMDENIWEDANEFKPERFLSEDGERIVSHEAFIPFSYGKRSCSGEMLAKLELFLFTTHLLQRYTIETIDGSKPSLESKMSSTLTPRFLPLKFVKRNHTPNE